MTMDKPDGSMGLTPQRELEISRWTWKAFLAGHADECDTDAVVDLIVDKTASIVDKQARQEMVEEIEKGCGHYDKDWINVSLCEDCWQELKLKLGIGQLKKEGIDEQREIRQDKEI